MLCHQNTLFGLHQKGIRPYLEWDAECTKTTLIAFMEDDHARIFSTFVSQDRDLSDASEGTHKPDGAALPAKNEMVRLALRGDAIEALCRFHTFHLFTVYDLHMGADMDAIDIDVYETVLPDTPDIPSFRRWLHQLWRLD